MIPLIVMFGAMVLGILAPQVEKHRAMKGVFIPPIEVTPNQAPGTLQDKPVVSPLEGKV